MTSAADSIDIEWIRSKRPWVWPGSGLFVFGATAVTATVLAGRLNTSSFADQVWWSLAFLPLLVAGSFVAALRPRSLLGWLLLVIGAGSELGRWQVAMVEAAGTRGGPSGWVVLFGDVLWWLSIPLVPFVVLLVPDGRLPSRRWRPAVGVGVVMWVLFGVAIVCAPGPLGGFSDAPSVVSNPLGISGFAETLRLVGRIGQIGVALTLLLAVVSLGVRWRNADGPVRRRLAWLSAPVVFGFAAFVIALAVGADGTAPTQIALVAFIVIVPVAICITVLTDDVPRIDDLARRAFVFGILAAFLTVTYVLLVLAVGSLLPGQNRNLTAVVATAAVAVLFAPVRERVRTSADRHLFGETGDHTAAVARLGRALADQAETTVLPTLVDAVTGALSANYVEITMNDGTREARGAPTGPILRRQLVWAGDTVGQLAVCLPPGSPQRAGVRSPAVDLVDAIYPFIAAAICAASLVNELRASRAGIVEALEDERRRIRRDLHDGLGPALAGIGLGLEATENLAAAGSPDVQARLRRLRDDVQTVYDDLRLLARGLRPPPLDDLGLVAALQSQAARLTPGDDALRIRIDVDTRSETLGSLPAAVELAAYHITMEALTNVVRHAHATRCEVMLRRGPELFVEIRDNGRWVTANMAGVGIHSMRERCEQLGGRIDLTHPNGTGTVVTAWLPIR